MQICRTNLCAAKVVQVCKNRWHKKKRYLNKSVCKIVRSSQWGGDVHPPGTANGLLPRKDKKSCTALTKSSKGAALPCPQEKQRGSCTALTEKQRVAALRPKKLRQRHKSPSPRILRSQKISYNAALFFFFSSFLTF